MTYTEEQVRHDPVRVLTEIEGGTTKAIGREAADRLEEIAKKDENSA